MIKIANSKDFDEIISLWNESFPNEEQFTKFYFENIFDINKTLIFVKDNKIVSMLQMLDFDSNMGKTMYIYGVCTKKEYRNQGIMAKMLTESFDIAKKQAYQYSIIVPAEEYLFDIYEKYGYKSTLNLAYQEYHKTVKSDILCEKLELSDYNKVNEIYENNVYGFYLKRNEKYFDLQCKLYKNHAVKFIENDNIIGYAFGYKTEDEYVLDEIMSQNVEKCLSFYEKVKYKTIGNNQKIGMIKSLNNENEPTGYINLMLN